MKRLLLVLLLCLLPLCAGAEGLTTHIVGCTLEGEYIHQLIADNGQTLYFTAMEPVPHVTLDDVNFDGVPDIAVLISAGASNAFYSFFVNDGGTYVFVPVPGQSWGVANYRLYPEQKLLLSQASNGYAGALHEWRLYRWEGNTLKTVRSAVAEEYAESAFSDRKYTVTTHFDRIHITVRDYAAEDGEGTVIYEKTVQLDEVSAALLDEESEMLWQGLN